MAESTDCVDPIVLMFSELTFASTINGTWIGRPTTQEKGQQTVFVRKTHTEKAIMEKAITRLLLHLLLRLPCGPYPPGVGGRDH